ncbi:hypothetical protein CLF_101804 [Clonorchis sinensis]|uniref:Uncharacterized protein n=1 Tax=Clonorchis sinensis TaxID=79923 RepID=G7Y6L7_CLOSI|nr:hypothetical protein CLF_101804 [Clonorchis sinensis]
MGKSCFVKAQILQLIACRLWSRILHLNPDGSLGTHTWAIVCSVTDCQLLPVAAGVQRIAYHITPTVVIVNLARCALMLFRLVLKRGTKKTDLVRQRNLHELAGQFELKRNTNDEAPRSWTVGLMAMAPKSASGDDGTEEVEVRINGSRYPRMKIKKDSLPEQLRNITNRHTFSQSVDKSLTCETAAALLNTQLPPDLLYESCPCSVIRIPLNHIFVQAAPKYLTITPLPSSSSKRLLDPESPSSIPAVRPKKRLTARRPSSQPPHLSKSVKMALQATSYCSVILTDIYLTPQPDNTHLSPSPVGSQVLKDLENLRARLHKMEHEISFLRNIQPVACLLNPDATCDPATLEKASTLIDTIAVEICQCIECRRQVLVFNTPDRIPPEHTKIALLTACGMLGTTCTARRLRKSKPSMCCPIMLQFQDENDALRLLTSQSLLCSTEKFRTIKDKPARTRMQRQLTKKLPPSTPPSDALLNTLPTHMISKAINSPIAPTMQDSPTQRRSFIIVTVRFAKLRNYRCRYFSSLNGLAFRKYMGHGHLTDNARIHGSLDRFSAFSFESFLDKPSEDVFGLRNLTVQEQRHVPERSATTSADTIG